MAQSVDASIDANQKNDTAIADQKNDIDKDLDKDVDKKNDIDVDDKKTTQQQYPNIDWSNIFPQLPIDNDGFVKSFPIIIDDDDEKLIQQNKQEIQDFFNKYGVVVIRDILNENDAKLSQNEVFDFIEKSNKGLSRNDPSTWKVIEGTSAKLGIIGDWPVMTPQICKNRINAKLYTAYSYILNTSISNIYTNIGRISWMRPTVNIKFNDNKYIDKPKWKTLDGKKWLHTDYDPLTNHCTTFGLMPRNAVKYSQIDTFDKVRTQGILALDDCSLNDGGFQCIPGFHKIMQDIWINKSGKVFIQKGIFQHRYQFKEADPLIKYITKCPIKKGSFLVWNSKLPHDNYNNNSNHHRMVQYIKYARYDDPAVKPVKFGVVQSGPWGMWPLNLEFPSDKVQLNDITKRLYGFGVADPDGDDKKAKQDDDNKNNDNIMARICVLL